MYLDPGALSHLKNLDLIAKTIVEGYFVGRHRSPYRGDSCEFDDFRPYSEGDELRKIDWKVLARTDRNYIKLFREETNLLTYIVLDKSRSMGYTGEGQISKLGYASFLIAALSYLLIRRSDKVGLTIFDDKIRWSARPGGTMPHLYTLLSALEETWATRETNLPSALDQCFPLFSRRGLLVVVSDFLDEPEQIFESLYRFRHKRFDVILFHILHPDEMDLPDGTHYRFVDSENGDMLSTDLSAIRKAYRERIRKHIEDMRRHALAQRVDYNLITLDQPYQIVLERYLQTRKSLAAWR